jgi:MSHA biogenesis protein MshN
VSLINKMLQDLESRQKSQGAADARGIYDDLKPVRAARARAPSRRLPVIVVAVVIVGAGAYAWSQWGGRLLSVETNVAAKPRAVAARPVPPRPVPALAPAPPAAPVQPAAMATAATQPQESPVATNREPVSNKVVTSEQTGPKSQAPIPPAEQPAVSAGDEVAGEDAPRYWTVTRGETLYRISTRTGITVANLSEWNHLGPGRVIHAGQRLRLTAPAASAAPEAAPAKTAAAAAGVVPAAAPSPERAKKPATAPAMAVQEERDADGTGVVDKKLHPLTPAEQAESEYRRAASLLQQGRTADAEQHLRAAIAASAEHTRARELLAGLLLQQGHWHEAQQLLEQGVAKVPAYYPFALLLARIDIDHGSQSKALAVMESSRQAGAGNADFMAFLAALYEREGNYAEAINAYTEALKLNPREGRSWLGMGLSLEAKQDWNAARAAYQRAIETGVLDDKLQNYARQRLAGLKNK